MKERILQFLESVKITPAEFADKIGVQRSSMSHILNGRNYPSAAFIQKMLKAYPLLNSRWLMIGEGTMNMELQPSKDHFSKSVHTPAEPFGVKPNREADLPTKSGIASETGSVVIPESNEEMPEINKNISGVMSSDIREGKILNQNEPHIQVNAGISNDEEKRIFDPSAFIPKNVEDRGIEQVLFFFKDKTFSVYRPS